MRQSYLLNKSWHFKEGFSIEDTQSPDLSSYTPVTLPHTVKEVPFNQFDENCYQGEFCYQLIIDQDLLSKKKAHQRALMQFEGVMAFCSIFVNGTKIFEHKGGYTPFEVDITESLNSSGSNLVTIEVDTHERSDIPPFGGQIDYLTYGGIYRDVHLTFVEPISIKNIKIETLNALSDNKSIRIDCMFRANQEFNQNIELTADLVDINNQVIASKTVTQNTLNTPTIELKNLTNLKLWSIEEPNLYFVRIQLFSDTGLDSYQTHFGIRSSEFKTDGFYLNGEKLKLRGINRHQAWPYLGYAVGNRAQRKDADLLKHEFGMNLVRTSHYPQSKAFLNRCDEIGLLVFEEIPGWQHIGDQQWRDQVLVDVKDMIERDWNCPSVILWGVRINESPDHEELYLRTNALAHVLDSTRQTGGVRCIENSQFLEDVFTMNDFIHQGDNEYLRSQHQITGLDHQVPYLVTEYNGHMFPTKRFDQEERQLEHTLRHLHILNAMYEREDVSGSVAWCFFDYNTHKDFGSGDRICYHGITDMFRAPKHAAFAYSSQMDPHQNPIVHAVTVWSRGERSIGGAMPLLVLTNCDYIEFQYGDQPVRKLMPDRETFPHLPYAPVLIDERSINPAELGEWGLAWDGLKINGVVDGQVVTEQSFAADPLPSELILTVDDLELNANEKELTRVVITALDQAGNPMPYWNPIVNLSIEGPGRIVGPSLLALQGGSAGSYIETTLETGTIQLTANVDCLPCKSITITVK